MTKSTLNIAQKTLDKLRNIDTSPDPSPTGDRENRKINADKEEETERLVELKNQKTKIQFRLSEKERVV